MNDFLNDICNNNLIDKLSSCASKYDKTFFFKEAEVLDKTLLNLKKATIVNSEGKSINVPVLLEEIKSDFQDLHRFTVDRYENNNYSENTQFYKGIETAYKQIIEVLSDTLSKIR